MFKYLVMRMHRLLERAFRPLSCCVYTQQNAGVQRESGQGNDLNVSAFERLIGEGMPYKALAQQHRMRPAIAALVRDIAYPALRDGPATPHRPPLRGVPPGNDIMFLSHAWPECADDGGGSAVVVSASKTNVQEARLAVAVLRYVLQQGYRVEEVALLTTYLGQLRLLREVMREAGIQELLDERDRGDLAALGDLDEVRGHRPRDRHASILINR